MERRLTFKDGAVGDTGLPLQRRVELPESGEVTTAVLKPDGTLLPGETLATVPQAPGAEAYLYTTVPEASPTKYGGMDFSPEEPSAPAEACAVTTM